MISELKVRYDVPIGYSDHSAKIATGIAAVALGAKILEFHIVFDKAQFGPDVTSSLTIAEAIELVKGVNEVAKALNHPVDKSDNSAFTDLKQIFEKSLAVNRDLKEGHILSFNDLEAKKPKDFGIEASNYKAIIGRKLSRDLQQWDFLTEDDI